jgi:hypothetical protein
VIDPLRAFLEAGAIRQPVFPPTSRYHGIETAEYVAPDGRRVAYLRRRFVPSPERFATLHDYRVVEGDRIDNVAARTLGDPEQYWRLCDANGALRPAELTERPGDVVRVTLPEGVSAPTE